MLAILSAGIAPGLALMSYFYLKDKYDSEPISLVLRSFVTGALLVFPIMFIQYVLQAEHVIPEGLWSSLLATSLLEEFFKWFILLYTAVKHIDFDEPYDGIVYGVAVSLGFATVENILYLLANGVQHAIGRALLPVSSHALFGVIMGYYFGKGKFFVPRGKWLVASLVVPFFLHGAYDYIITLKENWLIIITPFMLYLWWLGLRKVKSAREMSVKQIDKYMSINEKNI